MNIYCYQRAALSTRGVALVSTANGGENSEEVLDQEASTQPVASLLRGLKGMEKVDAQVVKAAVDETCKAAHGPKVATDYCALLPLKHQSQQNLRIELHESLLFMAFHVLISNKAPDRKSTRLNSSH